MIHGLLAPSVANDLRHKNVETLMLYLADAGTLDVFRERHGGNKMLENRVSPYNPKWVKCLDQYEEMMTSFQVKKNTKTFYELSGWFLFEKIGLDQQAFDNNLLTINTMMNSITSLTITKSLPKQNVHSTQEDLIEHIRQFFPASIVETHVATVRERFIQELNNSMKRHLELVQCVDDSVVPVAKKQKQSNLSVSFNNKVCQTNFNLEKNNLEKVKLMIQADDDYKQQWIEHHFNFWEPRIFLVLF